MRSHTKRLLAVVVVGVGFTLFGVSAAMALTVFVHTPANGTLALDSQPSETIAQIEADIQSRIGVDPSLQVLTFAGHTLDPSNNLASYNIFNSSASFYLTINTPVTAPVPDPLQRSTISGLQPVTASVGTAVPVIISGSFIEQISNIEINSSFLPVGSWTQTQSTVSFTLPASVAGSYQIQIFNGSAPVLAVQKFTVTPAAAVAVSGESLAKQKVSYIRCEMGTHVRIAYGLIPVCPVGYMKK